MAQPDDYVPAGRVEDMPPGSLTAVDVDGFPVVVGNTEGTYYAVGGVCSHLGSPLVLGTLHGHLLTCFAHLWTYDIRSGGPVSPPIARIARGYRLRTHPVRVEDGMVLVARRPGRLGLN